MKCRALTQLNVQQSIQQSYSLRWDALLQFCESSQEPPVKLKRYHNKEIRLSISEQDLAIVAIRVASHFDHSRMLFWQEIREASGGAEKSAGPDWGREQQLIII